MHWLYCQRTLTPPQKGRPVGVELEAGSEEAGQGLEEAGQG